MNLLLGLFNLLPIPPLDGSALLERALPEAWLGTWYRIRPYGFVILLGLIFFTGVLGDRDPAVLFRQVARLVVA